MSKFVYWCFLRYHRLWNSLAFVLAIEESEKSSLLLAKATSSGNHRYTASKGGIRGGQTFSKGQVNVGRQVGEIKELDTEEDAANMSTTVKSVMQWMKTNIPK